MLRRPDRCVLTLYTHEPTPIERWGRDHWSTLLYVEARAVDHSGQLRVANMRTLIDTHPDLIEINGRTHGHEAPKYPTRLRDDGEIEGHDDWDCIDDMIAADVVTVDGDQLELVALPATSFHSTAARYHLTQRGAAMAALARQERAADRKGWWIRAGDKAQAVNSG